MNTQLFSLFPDDYAYVIIFISWKQIIESYLLVKAGST